MNRLRTALLVVLLMMASACTGGSGSDSGGTEGSESPDPGAETGANTTVLSEPAAAVNEITYGLGSDGTGFNTIGAVAPGSIRIAVSVVEPLVFITPDEEFKPYLAESLTPNEDFTVWTIKVRPGINFHDGAPLNAAAVKSNLDAFRFSPTTGFVFTTVDSINVIDDLTLEVVLDSPWVAFPTQLTAQAGWVLSPLTIGQNDNLVGTGPFMFESWTPGDSARVVRNDQWWRGDDGAPFVDAVNFKVIPESSARLQALQAGDIDAYHSPSDGDIVALKASGEFDVYQSSTAGNEFLIVLNTAQPPTDDIRIRQAMAHAVDRDLLIETFRSGLTTKASSFVEPTSKWFVETEYPDFDLDRATALVTEYEAENGDATINLLSQNSSDTIEVAEFMASFWTDAGIDITIEPVSQGVEINSVLTDSFQATTWFQFSASDPDGQYVFMNSAAGLLNWSNLVDPEIDAAFDTGRASSDETVRNDAYAVVQAELGKELPFLWIDHIGEVEALVSRPGVTGFDSNTFPDGTTTAGLVAGSFHAYGQIKIDG